MRKTKNISKIILKYKNHVNSTPKIKSINNQQKWCKYSRRIIIVNKLDKLYQLVKN